MYADKASLGLKGWHRMLYTVTWREAQESEQVRCCADPNAKFDDVTLLATSIGHERAVRITMA